MQVGQGPNVGCSAKGKKMRLFCVYIVLYLGGGLTTSWSLTQGVLPPVKNDYGTEQEVRALNGLEEPL
jgi:hypothetical protein